jgi:hypothetical protein
MKDPQIKRTIGFSARLQPVAKETAVLGKICFGV